MKKKHTKNCQCKLCELLKEAGTPDKPGKSPSVTGYKTGGKW